MLKRFRFAEKVVHERTRLDMERVSPDVRAVLEVIDEHLFDPAFKFSSIRISKATRAAFQEQLRATPLLYVRVRRVEVALFLLDYTEAKVVPLAVPRAGLVAPGGGGRKAWRSCATWSASTASRPATWGADPAPAPSSSLRAPEGGRCERRHPACSSDRRDVSGESGPPRDSPPARPTHSSRPRGRTS
jgi:hypothetical protein